MKIYISVILSILIFLFGLWISVKYMLIGGFNDIQTGITEYDVTVGIFKLLFCEVPIVLAIITISYCWRQSR